MVIYFGIHVPFVPFLQMKHSTGNTMVLNSVNFANSGAYSCEVIADTTFHTLIQTKHMLVIGKGLSRNDVTFLGGEGGQPKSDEK